MRVFGLIGYPLTHSFSASYFADKFKKENIADALYQNFPMESISFFPELIEKTENLIGLNVTIPHKSQVLQYIDHLSTSASEIGAVNTIKIKREGSKKTLCGFNTDEHGFRNSLLPHLNHNHQKALILGTGGAAKAVEYVLSQLKINYKIVSRTPSSSSNEIAYSDLSIELIDTHKLIINTTPLGMYPKIDASPDIPYSAITSHHILYDLIYNPSETTFMKKGKEMRALVINGLQMLHLQAEKAWEIWNDPKY